jgi:hypothetical protein
MLRCFVFVIVVAELILEQALVGLALRSDSNVTRSASRRLLYPSGHDAINNYHDETFKIGLKLHSYALWRPDNKGFNHSLPASPAEAAQKTDAPKAHHKASDESIGKLSSLSDDHAPWHTNWNNSIAICASMQHENITDVVEWLSYYKYVPSCCAQVYKLVHLYGLGQ